MSRNAVWCCWTKLDVGPVPTMEFQLLGRLANTCTNIRHTPKTLFATHYHELNEMTETFDRIKNYNVSVKELKDNVLFLRTLVKGRQPPQFWDSCGKNGGDAATGFTPR